MRAGTALSTRISVAVLISLAVVTAAVTLFVIAHTNSSDDRPGAQTDLTSVIGSTPAIGVTRAP